MSSLKKILVVEDNSADRNMVCNILQEEYNIIEARNGKEALELLSRFGSSISVIILNLIMPVIDGYEVLSEIKKSDEFSKIPVIVACEQWDEESEIKALELGAIEYIRKPYNANIIKHRIANTIALREKSALVNSIQRDPLTGLYSKEYFYHCAELILQDDPDGEYDIVCCDIERFKLINDLYGVHEGDKLLKHTASMIEERVHNHGIACRMNGDVFVMIIKRPEEYLPVHFEASVDYVNRFNVNFNSILKYGVFQIEDKNMPISIMCDRAYLAVKSVKGKFDVFYAFYDDKIRQKLLNEQFVVLNMADALKKGEFQVYYQPKYDLITEKIVRAEALVRWVHPERGIIPPGDFIPDLEKNGFITKLDIFVWEEVCKRMSRWIDSGNKPIPISVNMSRADIYNPNIDQILISIVKKYSLSPSLLSLEITETAYMENESELTLTLQKLKKLGFTIEMDDFGSGYSSLNMLSELPIDVLKLDMRFIQGDKITKSRKNVISFIISLARWLNMKVVAEGVENIEQVDLLKTLGCERAQGYYYARPMPGDEFAKLLYKSNEMKVDTSFDQSEKEKTATLDKNIILVFDEDGSDFEEIKNNLSDKYLILQVPALDKVIGSLPKWDSLPAAIILCTRDEDKQNVFDEIIKQCKVYDIPVITLHDSNELVADYLHCGVSDCITRPYLNELLEQRIANAIARMQIIRFKKEREISNAITEMKKRAEQDNLTGLLNRAELEIRIEDFFRYNKRPEGVFLIIDIDHFKNINDSLGHLIGDRVLCAIADFIHEVFPETNMISRLGGDEFAVFIPYKIEQAELKRKLVHICNSFTVEMGEIDVSCSVGVVFSPEYGLNYEELYYNGQVALLKAKEGNKKQYVIYESGMDDTQKSFDEKALALLNDVSDAMFVCDAVTNEILYINNTACHVVNMSKEKCLGKYCHELFWNRSEKCNRCEKIDGYYEYFYEEDAVLVDGKTNIHIKAKVSVWDGRRVKIHYLQLK
ncbi:MAG: EAL domain-containing protein [Anaerovoracaceae bacterium]